MSELSPKEKVKRLVEDFRSNYSHYKKLAESDVETKLVEELFINILGWTKNDFFKQENVRRGEKRGRADYTFYIGDKVVFFLEVKKVGIPLDREADRQVISYALSRKVPLAVSTNFEQMNIFCVEQENALKNVFRIFKTPEDYLNNFQDLWFLSKESFEKGLLLKKAEEEGRLKRRVSIDKQLLEDLMRIRGLIASDIEKKYPTKYTINEKDDIVQRILDRLIFIRRCEDTGINPDNLVLEEIKHLPGEKAYPKLKSIFKRYDEVYNSGLFTIGKDNDCDKINIDGEIIKKLVYFLYESKDGTYIYNFDWIDADVLGQVYEQYLGKILAQTKSGKAKLKEGQAHRKEQGIYYTPTYIVDYIVKNTIGELLKDKKVNAREIKILDPACGSGSFLIKAFDYLDKHLSVDSAQRKLDSQGAYSVKTEILKNNLYGVDLDNKAVEITKLNLLLKAAEKNRKLPEELDMHIQHGNSLIDDEAVSKDAFHWVDDFAEGGFDVVIGNPPYVRVDSLDDNDKRYWKNNFLAAKGKYDLYYLFVEAMFKHLEEGKFGGFIIPNKFCAAFSAKALREIIINNCGRCIIISVSKLPIFTDASNYPVILIVQKGKKLREINIRYIQDQKDILTKKWLGYTITKEDLKFLPNNIFPINIDENEFKLALKILKTNHKIGDYLKISEGLRIPKEFEENQHKIEIVKQYQFDKWGSIKKGTSISENNLKKVISPNSDRYINSMKTKILIAEDALSISATLDENKLIPQGGVYFMVPEIDISLKYTLAVLNSKLLSKIYKILYGGMHMGGGYLRYRSEFLEQLPFKIVTESHQQPILKLVDRMLSLNKQLQSLGDKKTAQTAKLEEEIKRTDQEIDELVYKIYGITEEEKKIIEESLG